MLEAAGLSSTEIAAWEESRPAGGRAFVAAAPESSEYLIQGERLLARLPERPGRSDAEAEAATRLKAGARRRAHPLPARPRGGRLPLADGRPQARDSRRRSGLRRGGAVPGARPDAQAGGRRAGAGASRQGGRRDRAGALLRVRPRLGALRLAPRLGDAAADPGGARAARRLPRDRGRRPRRHVSRAARRGRLPRDPQRQVPERGGLPDAADHRSRGRPGVARSRTWTSA